MWPFKEEEYAELQLIEKSITYLKSKPKDQAYKLRLISLRTQLKPIQAKRRQLSTKTQALLQKIEQELIDLEQKK